MKSITIHNLDEQLSEKIQQKAKEEGISLNKAIKKLLVEALGLEENKTQRRREQFLDLFGVWSKEEEQEFERRIADLETVHPEDWK